MATLDATGAIGPVEGLGAKLKAVRRFAPGIRRVLVCTAQSAEAERHGRGHLKVLAFRSASEAVTRLFGEPVVAKLVQAGVSPTERDALIASLLRLVLLGRGQHLAWSPIERAAAKALETWTGLVEHQRYTLEFVQAVAARHQGNRGLLGLPPPSWLADFPLQSRLRVLAHLVQQSTDTGSPTAAEALKLAMAAVPSDPRSAYAPELQLAGAVARLEALSGRVSEALARQEALARASLESLSYEDVSHPLSEWLRLAGVVGDRHGFDMAVRFSEEAATVEATGPEDEAYIVLARERARVMLGLTEGTEPNVALHGLVHDLTIPDAVRRSAARWRLASLRKLKRTDKELALARQDLQDACPGTDPDACVFLLLAELDDALDAGNQLGIDVAIAGLRHAEGGLVTKLLEAAPASDSGAYVARHYPY